ncbi:1266_t:CDS:2 [Funneliformis caledonium]|uniref:1266_t:CDS:1 n=1 Tax=Funneliformis caledonium TaxID=1117310 RepID=A0A9N9BRS6_9GLOM|nr:1266_t:CDS:2 [Funneliformis caledonium]
MSRLFFEIPVMIGAIEISRVALLDPLAKVSLPYFKTTTKHHGYTNALKCASAVALYYLLADNFMFLPIYFLKVAIGTIIGTVFVCSILCNFTPLWEILMTSFVHVAVKDNKASSRDRTSNLDDVIVGNLVVPFKQQQLPYNNNNETLIKTSERNHFLQLGIKLSNENNYKLSFPKKFHRFNQNVQKNFQHEVIIMNASVLVRLNRLLSIPSRSSTSRSRKIFPATIPIFPRKSLLICDSHELKKPLCEFSEKQVHVDAIEEVYVAPPGDLFLSEKIDKLDQELVYLKEHESFTRELISQKVQQNDLIDEEYESTKKIHQELISQIERIDNQKHQYQVQVQENIISKDVTKITIPAFTIKRENSKKFAIYVIMVQRLDAATGQVKSGWIVPRRYNEFSLLNKYLKKHHSSFVKKFQLPGKTLLNTLDNSFLESRRIQLENFLQGILTNDEICEEKQFLKFLSKEN